MSWISKRPIYNRLPSDSGNWQGNKTVDILTGYWDDLLVSHYEAISEPTDWLGDPLSEMSNYFLDWVGMGLCGFGDSWNQQWNEQTKRLVIRNWVIILSNRTSKRSLQTFVSCIQEGAKVITYDLPRADFARADASWVGNQIPMLYHVNVPKELTRNSQVWMFLETLLTQFFPVGHASSRVQYGVAMADLSLAGDSVGHSSRSYLDQETN